MPLRIHVCLKPIPENPCAGGWRLMKDSETSTGSDRFRMNLYDAHALEAALQWKARLPDVFVQAIGIGPCGADTVLKRAVGMGADRAVHGRVDAPMDPLSIASVLAKLVQRSPCDLLFFGYMAEDSQQALAGPMTAALLDWPCLTAVVSEQMRTDMAGQRLICATRELEAGVLETIACSLPAVLTIQTRAVQPRYPVLSKMLRSGELLETIDEKDMLPLPKPTQEVVDSRIPEASRSMVRLDGRLEDQVLALMDWLRLHHRLFSEAPG